eukprot:9469037-Ditylum_brightwellii.AAC.1
MELQPSLHLSYFRRRAASRSYQMTKAAKIGPEPCTSGSHWRKFAFTQNDLFLAVKRTKTNSNNYATPGYTVDVVTYSTSSGTKYGLFYAGSFRTILDKPLQALNGEVLDMDGKSYQLCQVDEIEGNARDYPDRLGLFVNRKCVLIKG